MNYSKFFYFVFAFALLQLSAQTLIYSEDFEGGGLPAGYAINNSSFGNWSYQNSADANSGSGFLEHGYNPSGLSDNWVYMVGINLTAGNLYELRYFARTYSASWAETYDITVGTSQAPGTQSVLTSYTDWVSESYTQKTATYTPSSTGIYYFAFHCTSNDKWDLRIDDIELYETITCVAPTAGYSIVPDCANGQFSIDVNVTGLGDGTAVDINDGTNTYQSNVGNGTYTVGPFTAGDNVVINVDGNSYGGCIANSGNLTEDCNCTTAPSANYSINTDCGNGQFYIDVNISNLGDATGVDIEVDGVVYENNVGTGIYQVGPFAAATTQVVDVIGLGWVGCITSSGNLTEDCNCVTTPIASVNSANLDCVGNIYDVDVIISSFGSGSSADIYIDGVLVQTGANLSQLYSFSGYSTGVHNIEIEATGGPFVTCSEFYSVSEVCNGSDLCGDAPDISNLCSSGDLSVANVDGGALVQNYIGCGNGNNIALCGANATFTGSAYTRTDHTDIWYKIYPNGANSIDITISNLSGGNIMVLPYVMTSDVCPSSSGNNSTLSTHLGNPSFGGLTGFSCPYFTADGTLTLTDPDGTEVGDAAVIYLRVMPYANNGSGATNCETLTYASFDICTSIPQANDICTDALPIIDPATYLPITQSGNIASANADGGTSLDNINVNGSNCDAGLMTTNEEDLWYTFTTPATGAYYLELDIDFTSSADEMYVLLENYCTSGSGNIGCANISADGTIRFDQNNINNFGNELSSNTTYNVRIVLPSGSNASNFTISGQLLAKNDPCEIADEVFPTDFTITNTVVADFKFASASGADGVSGDDLWYVFDPNNFTDANGLITYSTNAQVDVSNLTGGESFDLMLYKRHGSSNNCLDLANDYLSTLSINANGTYTLTCLDELHGTSGTGDGYILRVVQTSGDYNMDPNIIVTPSTTAPPYNNSCVNIFDGSGPRNLGGPDFAHEFNYYYLLDGETITGNFTGSTDCDAEIASSDCSGVSNDPIDPANGRDLWYIFKVPDDNCNDLTVSTVINDMYITYDAGNAFLDAKIYIYEACGDGNLLTCSGTLDGAGETFNATGLTQGNYYLIRVKPSHLNSNFDYSFDLSLSNGVVRPCNDEGVNAMALSVNACNDYDNLPVYSMKGASQSPLTGVPESDVWFTFTAPDPANGGDYFVANKSWVTIFFENVGGTNSGPIYLELYLAPTAILATANRFGTTSISGSQEWAHFGHLEPGQTYYVRMYHKDLETDEVDYKVNVYTPNVNDVAWACGNNNTSMLTTGCSEGCSDLRESWFEITLPDGLSSDKYYMIEVVGYDQILDFELRSQHLTESSATHGDYDDYDHPCASRTLDPQASIVSTFPNITNPISGESCNGNGDAADGGLGVRRVYTGIVTGGNTLNYFIKVFQDPSDPNYATTTGLNICAINFNGPYETQASAEAGGAYDVDCSPSALDVNLLDFFGERVGRSNKIYWNTASETNNDYYELAYSTDGINYKIIAYVDGKGNTSLNSTYAYEHAPDYAEKHYYRLSQVDYDYSKTTFDPIVIDGADPDVKIYPNPSQNGQFNVSSLVAIKSLKVIGIDGAILADLEFSDTEMSSYEFKQSLVPGVYLIQTTIGNMTYTQQLIVE